MPNVSQVRHHVPAFHEIIDRAVAAHELCFGVAVAASRNGSLSHGSPPRKSSALGSTARRATGHRHRSSSRERPGAMEGGGGGVNTAAVPSVEVIPQQLTEADPDLRLALLGSDPHRTFATASLEISTAPYGRV